MVTPSNGRTCTAGCVPRNKSGTGTTVLTGDPRLVRGHGGEDTCSADAAGEEGQGWLDILTGCVV